VLLQKCESLKDFSPWNSATKQAFCSLFWVSKDFLFKSRKRFTSCRRSPVNCRTSFCSNFVMSLLGTQSWEKVVNSRSPMLTFSSARLWFLSFATLIHFELQRFCRKKSCFFLNSNKIVKKKEEKKRNLRTGSFMFTRKTLIGLSQLGPQAQPLQLIYVLRTHFKSLILQRSFCLSIICPNW